MTALAFYIVPRLGLGEKERMVSIKVVAVEWPKRGTPQAFEPVWVSHRPNQTFAAPGAK